MLVCLIALIGGGASVAWVLASGSRSGAVTVGPWTAFPDSGTRNADPYAQAEASIEGMLSLGRSEGISFTAERDSSGAPLEARCAYRVAGDMPAGRFWTLRTEPLDSDQSSTRPAAIHSRGVLRDEDNSVQIQVGHKPLPGNWLRVQSPEGGLRMVLTIYDTSLTAGPSGTEKVMPSILRTGCDA